MYSYIGDVNTNTITHVYGMFCIVVIIYAVLVYSHNPYTHNRSLTVNFICQCQRIDPEEYR